MHFDLPVLPAFIIMAFVGIIAAKAAIASVFMLLGGEGGMFAIVLGLAAIRQLLLTLCAAIVIGVVAWALSLSVTMIFIAAAFTGGVGTVIGLKRF